MKGLLTIKIIFLVCICTNLFISCKPKTTNSDCHEDGSCPPEFYRIKMNDAKHYFWSLPGSYWIYKNTNNGQLDTQVCTSFSFDSILAYGTKDRSYIKIKYDILQRTISCSYKNIIMHESTGFNSPDDKDFNNGRTILNRNSYDYGEIFPFFFPFDTNSFTGDGVSLTSCNGNIDSLMIQGKTYFNVIKFSVDFDNSWENSPPYSGSNYFWVRDIGLIKKKALQKSDNWELIDYKIIK